MKKTSYLFSLLALCGTFALVSCGDDDENNVPESLEEQEVPHTPETPEEQDKPESAGKILTVTQVTGKPDYWNYARAEMYEGGGMYFQVVREDGAVTAVIAHGQATVDGEYDACPQEMVVPQTIVCGDKKFTVNKIGSFGFCRKLTKIELPNSIIWLGEGAFDGCESLANIELPNSLTSIEANAFTYCTSLTNVVIPNSVTKIGGEAFSHCQSLKSVTIGSSVKEIESYTFEDCPLTEITSLNPTPPNCTNPKMNVSYSFCIGWWDNKPHFHYDYIDVLKVPASAVEAYKKAEEWKKFKNIQGI